MINFKSYLIYHRLLLLQQQKFSVEKLIVREALVDCMMIYRGTPLYTGAWSRGGINSISDLLIWLLIY